MRRTLRFQSVERVIESQPLGDASGKLALAFELFEDLEAFPIGL